MEEKERERERVREKESEGEIERERGREIFPHRLEKPTPHQPGTVGASGGGGGVEETRGGLRERRKEGARRVTQGGLGGGWGRQPQKYTATTPRGSTAEAAIFHRRTETRPRELNTLSYLLVEAALPPRRSNGQVKNHRHHDADDNRCHSTKETSRRVLAILAPKNFSDRYRCARTKRCTTEDRDRRFDRRELKSLLPVFYVFSFCWIFFRHR